MQRVMAPRLSTLRTCLAAALAAVLAACGGNSTAQLMPASSVSDMRQACCAKVKTVYITDAFGGSSFTGAVYGFNYNTAQPIGELSAPPEGWLEVQGACVDNDGHAYFANTEESTVDEFTSAGIFVEAISDPGQFPVDCAYDALSGNLALANIVDTSGGPGSISIYHGGTFKRTLHPPNMSRVYSVGYQGGTNTLWLSGSNSSGIGLFDTLSNGKFAKVTIRGLTGGTFGSSLQWSAKTRSMNIAGSDASSGVIWHVSPEGRVIGKTPLDCVSSSCGAASFFIEGPRVAVVYATTPGAALFDYPAGGKPIMAYKAAFVQPIGIVVAGP